VPQGLKGQYYGRRKEDRGSSSSSSSSSDGGDKKEKQPYDGDDVGKRSRLSRINIRGGGLLVVIAW